MVLTPRRLYPYLPIGAYRDYITELARRCEMSQNSVGSPNNADSRWKSLLNFTRWRCYGVPQRGDNNTERYEEVEECRQP